MGDSLVEAKFEPIKTVRFGFHCAFLLIDS